MMNTSSTLARLLEGFFIERLMTQNRASSETVAAYRDTFRLLLRYAQREMGKVPSLLSLEDLDASFICAFLNYLEEERQNSPRTRNHRLAAIRSFFRYASFQEPQLSGHIQRILVIPSKRWQKHLIDFLTVDEVDAILGVIDTSSWVGRRDYALITLAIHTGLRVSELIHLSCEDITLGPVAYVRCYGKGRKQRSIPISKKIVKVFRKWLHERGGKPPDPLFPNMRGGKLSRDGVAYILSKYVKIARQDCPSLAMKRVTPHVLRHTTAVHLLQAGVDLPVIALWLGHESVESAQIYIDSDLTYKRKILEKTIKIDAKPLTFQADDELIAFLQRL